MFDKANVKSLFVKTKCIAVLSKVKRLSLRLNNYFQFLT